jgi:hypothetical protein
VRGRWPSPRNLGRARSTQSQEKKLRRIKGTGGDLVAAAFDEIVGAPRSPSPRHGDSWLKITPHNLKVAEFIPISLGPSASRPLGGGSLAALA